MGKICFLDFFLASKGPLHFLAHGNFLPSCQTLASITASPYTDSDPPASFLWGSLWFHWAHLENPRCSSHLRILHLITSAKSFLPRKVTYSQVLGLGMWRTLGGPLFSPSHWRLFLPPPLLPPLPLSPPLPFLLLLLLPLLPLLLSLLLFLLFLLLLLPLLILVSFLKKFKWELELGIHFLEVMASKDHGLSWSMWEFVRLWQEVN